jgi:hypothetical protein
MSDPVDPTKVRMSKTFMLSDFVGNYSTFHSGIRNPVYEDQAEQIKEGKVLAEYLDTLQSTLGVCRVSYGLIHPSHSEQTVKWKPGNLPSLHRWDDGACADVCFVHRDRFMGSLGHWDDCQDAPINTALWISREHPSFTRMITYSQSPWICIGVKTGENPRLRFYENRFIGEGVKPEFIKHNGNAPVYLKLYHGWKGEGVPVKRKQYQHVQVSATTYLSDYLYDKNKVHKGVSNLPPMNGNRASFMRNLQRAGRILDRVHEIFGSRVSIVKAYDCDKPNEFRDGFNIEFIPALGVFHDAVSDFITDFDKEVQVKVGRQKADCRRIRMTLRAG